MVTNSKPPENPDEFSIPARVEKPLKIKLKGPKGKYDAMKKDIPADAPATWIDPDDGQTKTITWFNNFGLKLKGHDNFEEDVDEYDIELDKADVKTGSDLVYYSKGEVIKFRNVKRNGAGKLTVSLNLGDPSIGESP